MVSNSSGYLYGFATSHVQKYILASPLLRDIQGASQLLEDLCGKTFRKTAEKCGMAVPPGNLSAAAGGVRLFTSCEEGVRQLYRIWPSVAESLVPGASIQQAVVRCDFADRLDANRRLSRLLSAKRSVIMPKMPDASPFVSRCRRTGEPGIGKDRHENEVMGPSISARRRRRDRMRSESRAELSSLDVKCMPESFCTGDGDIGFALDQNEIRSSAGFVAIIHADGNDLGKRIVKSLRALGDTEGSSLIRAFRGISETISTAMEESVRIATKECLPVLERQEASGKARSYIPARPVILGGDDITILVRADMALDFVCRLLSAFEEQSHMQISKLRNKEWYDSGLGEQLNMASGIAYVKEGFPFDRGYALAESLCEHAKDSTPRDGEGLKACSSICFHRVTVSLPGNAEAARAEYSVPGHVSGDERGEDESIQIGTNVYRAGGAETETRLPSCSSLQRIVDCMQTRYASRLRNIASDLYSGIPIAKKSYLRFHEVESQRDRPLWGDFESQLLDLIGSGADRELPLLSTEGWSPIADILALNSLGRSEGGSGVASE